MLLHFHVLYFFCIGLFVLRIKQHGGPHAAHGECHSYQIPEAHVTLILGASPASVASRCER